MSYTLQRDRRYKATLTLGFLESLASNATIAARFMALGFSDVKVTGEGATRYAEGVWNAEETTLSALPRQIADVSPADL
jgi:hypothetical protein